MGTTCEGKVLHLIKKQLAADCAALEAGESVSLLAKWLPSVNASNEDVIRQAKRIARAMGMNDAQYRKTLSALRTKISIIENNLREKDYTFDYSKQPSKAMFKYRKAFMRNDGDRYDEFMSRVAEGTEQLHTGTLTPYEMIKPFFGRGDISDQERKAIDATWKTQEDFTGGENALVVIDGSGSMYGGADPIPASLICSGKGNEDWNCSAPHGAGRLMSRKAAFNALSMEEFQKEMEGIYTTCVVPDTLDESPMAYKSMEEIVAQIGPTAEIIERIRPVYNFKAAD